MSPAHDDDDITPSPLEEETDTSSPEETKDEGT